MEEQKKDRRTFMEKVMFKKHADSFLDDRSSQNKELFQVHTYVEVLQRLFGRSVWITIGALLEVLTESIVSFAMIKTNNVHDAFQATTAFGLCLVFTHLF